MKARVKYFLMDGNRRALVVIIVITYTCPAVV
jgi:hypothetical protein